MVRTQWETLPDTRQEVDRIHVRGDQIVTVGRFLRRMPDSDARLEIRFLLSWEIREGKVIRVQVLGAGSDFQHALEAAGLPE